MSRAAVKPRRGRFATRSLRSGIFRGSERMSAAIMKKLSRLEILLVRLQAQAALLDWAFEDIARRAGLVFELGLGHGRTHDHLRKHLPNRDIYVFDREVDCYPDCQPDPQHLILGELSETLPEAAKRFARQAALVHADLGSYYPARNQAAGELVSRLLPPILAAGCLVLSDLPLAMAGADRLPMPGHLPDESYFIYRAR